MIFLTWPSCFMYHRNYELQWFARVTQLLNEHTMTLWNFVTLSLETFAALFGLVENGIFATLGSRQISLEFAIFVF